MLAILRLLAAFIADLLTPNFNSIVVSLPTSRAQHIDFTRLYFWAPNYLNLCDAKLICVHVLYD